MLKIVTEIKDRAAALTGASTDDYRTLRREYSKRVYNLSGAEVLDVAHELLASGAFPLRFIAYELVQHHKYAASMLTRSELERLAGTLGAWAEVDIFSLYLLGPAWRTNQVTDRYLSHLTKSKDPFWRRAALVATVALNSAARGGGGDTQRTVDICKLLIRDRDDIVLKALSWALRELSKHDTPAVERFIHIYRQALAARVLREVKSKLSIGRKNS